MEGGNGESVANEVTLCSTCASQNDEAENLPRMDSALGVLHDGVAVKEKRKPPKTIERGKSLRPAGSRLYQPPKKPHAKSAKFAKF